MVFIVPLWLATLLTTFFMMVSKKAELEIMKERARDKKKLKALKKRQAARQAEIKRIEAKMMAEAKAEFARQEKSKAVQADMKKRLEALQVEMEAPPPWMKEEVVEDDE